MPTEAEGEIVGGERMEEGADGVDLAGRAAAEEDARRCRRLLRACLAEIDLSLVSCLRKPAALHGPGEKYRHDLFIGWILVV